MNNVLIFGNSGSGKSTFAKKLSQAKGIGYLDLDTIAWKPTSLPERKTINESKDEIVNFVNSNSSWVIEGCYTDLLQVCAPFSSEIIFMNLPIELCISNARKRSWEPHKYESKEAQDSNLEMLINWINQYSEREDTFSEKEHKRFYNEFSGEKSMITCNE